MSETIFQLVAQARMLAGDVSSELCGTLGHEWESQGGRTCPRDYEENCSQAVYVCARCGEQDYGEAGGPGHEDCTHCAFAWRHGPDDVETETPSFE